MKVLTASIIVLDSKRLKKNQEDTINEPVSRQVPFFSQENMPYGYDSKLKILEVYAGFLGGNLFDDFLMSEGKTVP